MGLNTRLKLVKMEYVAKSSSDSLSRCGGDVGATGTGGCTGLKGLLADEAANAAACFVLDSGARSTRGTVV